MARVGGRNALFAWIVGIGCAAIVGVLAVLAVPMIPASIAWLDGSGNRSATAAPSAEADPSGAAGVPTECAQLYDAALWATLHFANDSILTPSTDAPTTTAEALVSALQPQVTLTCGWHSELGTVSTTLATVPTDAGAIASAALPGVGFTCVDEDERTRCTRTDGDLTETIEAGGGLWLSTSEAGWHPSGHAQGVAERVWG